MRQIRTFRDGGSHTVTVRERFPEDRRILLQVMFFNEAAVTE